ncbi:isochorismatase family protein [Amantichitinum ursilacus]|uniref:Streptothricin hydrolase n=1 Tax=Amantichitinum ursilacus TaxID=857265 RepID=A0A0N0XL85_9NEIS|nr:isochorismatase family protein [Amantichitinum ursilacus]KPC55425.1 Streptothricin hydrolase [Amantichitinum ursilacus]
MSDALSRSALLIIDMQVGHLHGPEVAFEGDRVVANINALIARARAGDSRIIAVRHTGPDGSPIAKGSPLWQIAPELDIDPARDLIINKTRASVFVGTGLATQLADLGVGRVLVTGMKTQYCIDTACRAAPEHGLQPVLIADAHTCMDTPEWSAVQMIAYHNRVLAGPVVQLATTADVQF